MDAQRKSLARARFKTLLAHPPSIWNQDAVSEFHETVSDLEAAYLIDLSSVRVPESELEPRARPIQRAPPSGRFPACVQLFPGQCDEQRMQRRLKGIQAFLADVEIELKSRGRSGESGPGAAPSGNAEAQPAPGDTSSRGQGPEPGGAPWNLGATTAIEDLKRFHLTSNEPLGKNPFPKGDQRHDGWVAASRIARKNLMLYNSGLLDRMPAVDAPREETEGWWAEMIIGRFAIMSSAAAAVFGSTDEGIAAVERLIDHFAEFALAQAEKVVGGRTEKGSFLLDVRTKLMQYREHVVGTALGWADPSGILRDTHAVTPDLSVGDRNDKRKRVRRNAKYEGIDEALREIAKSRPKAHEEVFQALEGRSKLPNAEPFKTAGGWHAGFKKDAVAARAWLSKAWSRLNLPAFLRGPK